MACEAPVNSKGQITIPAEVRKAMGLEPGERVVFSRPEDGPRCPKLSLEHGLSCCDFSVFREEVQRMTPA